MLDIEYWTNDWELMERQFRLESEKHFRQNFTGDMPYMLADQEERELRKEAEDKLRKERPEKRMDYFKATGRKPRAGPKPAPPRKLSRGKEED